MFFVEIDGVLHSSTNLPPTSINPATIDRRERRKRSKMMRNEYCIDLECQGCDFPLAPLPKAVPAPMPEKAPFWGVKQKACKKEEGKTSMRYNDNTAIASIVATKSDAAVQREYFLSRLQNAWYPKSDDLQKVYKLNVTAGPKNFEELIDMIKNDKFKVNKKAQAKLDEVKEAGDNAYWGYGSTYGIEWDGPKADWKGYELAQEELGKAKTAAEDVIMSGDAAAMAKAVADFEAWTPTGNAS